MLDLDHSKKSKISAVIICHNEAHNLERCIKSCVNICDEIIVVDGFSTDGTSEIAKKFNVTFIQKEWLGYGQTKNFGAKQASTDWILSIDADECLDQELQGQIKNLQKSPAKIYSFKRLNFIGKQAVRYGEWNPDIKPRIYNKQYTRWNDRAVHESLVSDSYLEEVLLPGCLLHYSYSSLLDLQERLGRYAKLGAKDLHEKNTTSINFMDLHLRPLGRFFKSYIIKCGFLDGKVGWQIALENAKAVKKRYNYLKELLKTSP